MPEKIAVIIPCYNEGLTIAKVVSDFKRELPKAKILVYDNNSTDDTIAQAKEAEIHLCSKQGKGAVLRKAFHEVDADIYVIVDGDDTYPAESVHALIDCIRRGADMAVGDRISSGHYFKENKRPLHNFGNLLVCKSINLLFKNNVSDVMSGYRALSKRFVKNCPILVNGFDVETEITLHAIDKLFTITETPVPYRDRPPGSFSKLNTVADGILVLRSILWIFKDSKPLVFFSLLALAQGSLAALAIGYQLLVKSENPFAFPLGLTLLATSAITVCAGFILDTLSKFHKENFETQLLKNHENKHPRA